jgi:hypothetical protein
VLRSEKGQTVVEFALVAPLLVAVVFAIIEFGVVFHQYLRVTDLARTNARLAAISHTPASVTDDGVTVSVPTPANGWVAGQDVTATASAPYTIDVPLLGIVIKSGTMTSTTTEKIE